MPRQASNGDSSDSRNANRYVLTFVDHGMDSAGIMLGSVLCALFVHVDTGERALGELKPSERLLCHYQNLHKK